VIHRDVFLRALGKNEDDTMTRLVYADWLDEQGEPEEADRQRKWTAAKAWLVKLCQDYNEYPDYEMFISYPVLIDLAWEAVEEAEIFQEPVRIHCCNNMNMCDALRSNHREFWKNWSIVTGLRAPPDVEDGFGQFSCGC
jgi:uncharacterized protein (TIGR02996 family)